MSKIKSLILFIVWFAAGFLSWLLSVYLFSYVFSSLVMISIRSISAVTNTIWIKNLSTMILAHFIEYFVCFLVIAILSFFTKSTSKKLIIFIFGMVGLGVYYQLDGLVYYSHMYSELPMWVITYELQGFISLLLIMPLMAFLGSKTGNVLKNKVKTDRQPRPMESVV